jgi:hypothetical protein
MGSTCSIVSERFNLATQSHPISPLSNTANTRNNIHDLGNMSYEIPHTTLHNSIDLSSELLNTDEYAIGRSHNSLNLDDLGANSD